MTRRSILMATASARAFQLIQTVPAQPDWYGAIDAGYLYRARMSGES